MNLELRQLRYFLAVAEEMHFGRAAAKLHMTQPPLSQAIQAFEQSLGVSLFTRSTRQIQLTAAGLALIPEARRILAASQALPELLQRAASGASGELSLAFVSIADYSILPPFLREFRKRYPDVRIHLQEATSDRQFAMLEDEEIDAGLMIPPLPARLQDFLQYQTIRSEPLILAIPENEKRHTKIARLDEYKHLPLIIFHVK